MVKEEIQLMSKLINRVISSIRRKGSRINLGARERIISPNCQEILLVGPFEYNPKEKLIMMVAINKISKSQYVQMVIDLVVEDDELVTVLNA
jgi:hypothetical protein